MADFVLFDLDGTLTDSAPGIINSVIYALNKFGITSADRTFLRKFIGPPLIDSFMKYYGFDKDKAVLAVKYYREYFSDTGIFENSVYEGIQETLNVLKASGKKLILSTSKPQLFSERILKHFNLDQYFELVAGATMDEGRTRKDEVIAYVIDSLLLLYHEYTRDDLLKKMIMIGDRENDISGAKVNGIPSIGVLYGFGDRKELEDAGADYIVDAPRDLIYVLLPELD